MVEALIKEIQLERNFFGANHQIETIYFGGGTPSIISPTQLAQIIHQINQTFSVDPDAEITVECNPDDITSEKLAGYQASGVNRLSIGIQSFQDKFLKAMNRAHTAKEAQDSIQTAKQLGIYNITIDLIYGVPDQSLEDWYKDIDQALALDVPHISAYSLTIEPNTVFGHQKSKGSLHLPNDEQYLGFFTLLRDRTAAANMEHYEISNFAKEGFISKHNSAYWKGKPYLGIGPSAHSFDGASRSWNVANNFHYMKAVESGQLLKESEKLSTRDHFNEYLITRLRTKWGIARDQLMAISPKFYQRITPILERYLLEGNLMEKDRVITLTPSGMFISDAIAEDLYCL
jgi:oxygen-independent coproporphyrinogen-3 oxidase